MNKSASTGNHSELSHSRSQELSFLFGQRADSSGGTAREDSNTRFVGISREFTHVTPSFLRELLSCFQAYAQNERRRVPISLTFTCLRELYQKLSEVLVPSEDLNTDSGRVVVRHWKIKEVFEPSLTQHPSSELPRELREQRMLVCKLATLLNQVKDLKLIQDLEYSSSRGQVYMQIFPSLENLHISSQQGIKELDIAAYHRQIKQLTLEKSAFTEIQSVFNLYWSKLEILRVWCTEVISNCSLPLQNFPELKSLQIRNCQLQHFTIISISNLVSQVSALDLSENCLHSNRIFKQLSDNMPLLRILKLKSNQIDNLEGIESLCRLCHLDVSFNFLRTFAAVRSIAFLKSLKTLRLVGNPLCEHLAYRQQIINFVPHDVTIDSQHKEATNEYSLYFPQYHAFEGYEGTFSNSFGERNASPLCIPCMSATLSHNRRSSYPLYRIVTIMDETRNQSPKADLASVNTKEITPFCGASPKTSEVSKDLPKLEIGLIIATVYPPSIELEKREIIGSHQGIKRLLSFEQGWILKECDTGKYSADFIARDLRYLNHVALLGSNEPPSMVSVMLVHEGKDIIVAYKMENLHDVSLILGCFLTRLHHWDTTGKGFKSFHCKKCESYNHVLRQRVLLDKGIRNSQCSVCNSMDIRCLEFGAILDSYKSMGIDLSKFELLSTREEENVQLKHQEFDEDLGEFGFLLEGADSLEVTDFGEAQSNEAYANWDMTCMHEDDVLQL